MMTRILSSLHLYFSLALISIRAVWLIFFQYYDPNYSGFQIGEYSYYDWENSQWDNSTCVEGATCSKMDCHNTNTTSTTWSLVGVYKETLEVSKSKR